VRPSFPVRLCTLWSESCVPPKVACQRACYRQLEISTYLKFPRNVAQGYSSPGSAAALSDHLPREHQPDCNFTRSALARNMHGHECPRVLNATADGGAQQPTLAHMGAPQAFKAQGGMQLPNHFQGNTTSCTSSEKPQLPVRWMLHAQCLGRAMLWRLNPCNASHTLHCGLLPGTQVVSWAGHQYK
jgi:hypothetical protein